MEGVRAGGEAKGRETGQTEGVRETLETRQGQGTTRNGNVSCGRSLTQQDRFREMTLFGETGWRGEARHEEGRRLGEVAEAQADDSGPGRMEEGLEVAYGGACVSRYGRRRNGMRG